MGNLLSDLAEWTKAVLRNLGAQEHDAKEVASEAILKLITSWGQVRAKRGVYSLKAWLETTAIHEYLRRIRDEKRNRTESMHQDCALTHDEEGGLTKEELIADDGTPELWDSSLVREDDVRAVQAAMVLIVKDCKLKHRGALPPCTEHCELIWRRHAGYERATLEEMSEWVGRPLRTVYDWLKKCEGRFKKALESVS